MPSGPCLCGSCFRGGPPRPRFSFTVTRPIGCTHNEQVCREHASAGPILAAGRHNPVGFGWSMPRARGELSPYKRSWQNGHSVNLRTRQYSKVPQKSGSAKFALTEFWKGQLNPAPGVFLEKRVGVREAASTPSQNDPKYVADVALYGARVSVAGRRVG